MLYLCSKSFPFLHFYLCVFFSAQIFTLFLIPYTLSFYWLSLVRILSCIGYMLMTGSYRCVFFSLDVLFFLLRYNISMQCLCMCMLVLYDCRYVPSLHIFCLRFKYCVMLRNCAIIFCFCSCSRRFSRICQRVCAK